MKYPKDARVLAGYATFLELGMNDLKESEKYRSLAEGSKIILFSEP